MSNRLCFSKEIPFKHSIVWWGKWIASCRDYNMHESVCTMRNHCVLQSMVWRIPHEWLRRTALFQSGTLQDCTLNPLPSWKMQDNTRTLCNPKVKLCKHGTLATTYKGIKKELHSTNNVEYEFWLCLVDIKHCLSGNIKKYVLDWHIVLNTWLVKIGTDLWREEVLALVDVKSNCTRGIVSSS